MILDEGVVPLMCITSYTASFKWVDPNLAIMTGQSRCSSKSIFASFLYHYYEWPKWCSFVLNDACDSPLLTMTYSTAPLHSLVDGLRMKLRCHQKKGVTLRPWCLRKSQVFLSIASSSWHWSLFHKGYCTPPLWGISRFETIVMCFRSH